MATKYVSEDEINKRLSYVKGRPSLPFMKMDKNTFHDLTSQVTRGSLIFSPDILTDKEEHEVRFSFPLGIIN